MFDKILDVILNLGSRALPFEVIRVYQTGVVLRFGKCHRTMEPGFHWKWPFAEEVIEVESVTTTMRLPPQTLTTRDNVSVVISAIVKYQIVNAVPYVTEIWDARDVLGDVTMGAIRQAVSQMEYGALVAESPEKSVIEIVRNEVNKYGFKIHRITFIDLGRIKSFRFIQQPPKDLDN